MIGMKCFTIAIAAACRTFSTKSSSFSKTAKHGGYLNKHNKKKNVSTRMDPRIGWTNEQSNILDNVERGLSMFITGSAGTGKTILLKRIIEILKDVHGSSSVFVTASTGIAACALQGQTLHSFAGFGFDNADFETLLYRVMGNKRALKRWKTVKALVIDEISMVDANMFENLEYIAREIRKSKKVWGGIQLIVSGDFFQLPPIVNQPELLEKVFAFESGCWDASFNIQVELTKIFRQSDSQFVKLLQDIRKGKIDAENVQLLQQRCYVDRPDFPVSCLYPRIGDVNKVNEEKLKSLGKRVVTYKAVDFGSNPYLQLLKQVIAPETLVLCEGARVMLIKNLDIHRKLCNGATGTVKRFVKADDIHTKSVSSDALLPVVKFDSGVEIVIDPQEWEFLEGEKVVSSRKQIPLMLAWALSIHKCQGMTLDHIHTDLSRAFGFGMVYVALSRVRSLDGLYLSGFCPSKIKAHPKVLHFYEHFASDQSRADEGSNDDACEYNKVVFVG